MQPPNSIPLPLILLSGFLGSGKTTLLNRLLGNPSMGDTAVLINEVGEIGLDHLLVASVADDIILLESGCICCTLNEDLGAALESLHARRRAGDVPAFTRVIVETTGIADPCPVLQRILADESLSARYRIHGVVTVVDAVFGEVTLNRHLECASQAAVADRLVVSKLDLASRSQVDSLITCLRSINPTAAILMPRDKAPTPDELFGDTLLSARPDFRPLTHSKALGPQEHTGLVQHGRYTTFSFNWNEPLDWEDFKAWVEGLLLARGESVLRMKGLLNVAGRSNPVVVQAVQHALYPPVQLGEWPHGTPKSELVFVTRDFPREAALRSFRQFFAAHCGPEQNFS